MGDVTTIGLDIAKSVFQVHGVDAEGQVVLRQRLTRLSAAVAGRRRAGRHRQAQRGSKRAWLIALMGRRTTRVAAVALANKTARIAWAIMTSGEPCREPKVAAA